MLPKAPEVAASRASQGSQESGSSTVPLPAVGLMPPPAPPIATFPDAVAEYLATLDMTETDRLALEGAWYRYNRDRTSISKVLMRLNIDPKTKLEIALAMLKEIMQR